MTPSQTALARAKLLKGGKPMYYSIFDATNTLYAFTSSLRGAQDTARLIGGWYREAIEEDLADEGE